MSDCQNLGEAKPARSVFTVPGMEPVRQHQNVKVDAVTEESKGSTDDGRPDLRRPSAMFGADTMMSPSFSEMMRKIIRDEIRHVVAHHHTVTPQRLLLNPAGTRGEDGPPLLLEFVNKLPSTIFTGKAVVDEDGEPIKVRLVHGRDDRIITVGPLSFQRIGVVVLDGEFGCQREVEDWTEKEFNSNIIREREGRRPLLTGELSMNLQGGIGYIGEISFTDNSSWIRSRKFTLGARVIQRSPHEERIREAISTSFVVKDHRAEAYKKHYPPHLLDEVWRLEKISKGGILHKRLAESGILHVKDFLRLHETDPSSLRKILSFVSNRTSKVIIEHAVSCAIEDNEYYGYCQASQKPELLFNSVYKVVGATFDGRGYLPLEKLTAHEMHLVEKMKQQALQNLNDLLPIVATSPFVPYPATDLQKEPVGLKLDLQPHDVLLSQQGEDSQAARKAEPMQQGNRGRGCAAEVSAEYPCMGDASPVYVDDTVQLFQEKQNLSLPALLQSTEHPNKVIQKPVPSVSGSGTTRSSISFDNADQQDYSLAGCIEPSHRVEEYNMKMKPVMNQNQRESMCLPSEEKNSNVMQDQEDEPDLMLIGSIEETDVVQIHLEERLRCSMDNPLEDTDSCYTESDTEDATVRRAGRKHRKLTASEIFDQDIPTMGATLEEWSVVMFDANTENERKELLGRCMDIDDMLSWEWELFCLNAGEVVDDAEIQKIAKEIAKACRHNLRSITLMGKALSNVSDIETWEYALDSLSLQHASCHDDSENLSVNVLKLSIELLEDEVTIKCLKSFSMDKNNKAVARASLIDSWVREGTLTTHSEGEKVIKNLLDAKLLELSENEGHVKFIDISHRLVDLIFQPEGGSEFLMQGGLGLVEPPEAEEWVTAKEVCLMHNDLTELPENLRCPKLSTLFLQRNHKLRRIPSSFFNQMPALEVLNLSRTRIKSLPDSLFQLISLKRLFLNECLLLRTLSAKVGGLKNLEVLDLEGTKLMGLPEEIKQLTNLTCLEVSILGSMSCKLSKESYPLIPSGVLASLSHLEELNIDVGPDPEWWDSCVEVLINEICSLERLNSLKFYFPKVELLRQFNAASLSHFRLILGKNIGRIMSRLPSDIEFELEHWDRYLKYIHGEGILEDVTKVLKQAEALFLDRHADLEKLSDFGKENLEQLKCCVMGECNELQVLVDGEDFMEEGDRICLGSLEYLYLYYMKNLKNIWRGPVRKGSLSCLKSLTMRTCPKMTSIFTQELLENLCSLDELTVEDCPALVSLVSSTLPAQGETSYYLPKLRKMSLHYLPKLTSISGGLQVVPSIEWLSFYDCPNLRSLDLSLEKVKKIRGQSIWWEGLKWTGDCADNLDDLFIPISANAIP